MRSLGGAAAGASRPMSEVMAATGSFSTTMRRPSMRVLCSTALQGSCSHAGSSCASVRHSSKCRNAMLTCMHAWHECTSHTAQGGNNASRTQHPGMHRKVATSTVAQKKRAGNSLTAANQKQRVRRALHCRLQIT